MARDVNEILINLCKTEGNMSTADATQYIKDLGQKTRYVLDVWS
jgi:sulfite reductase alpha subunit-like flavoprotein